jgi:HAD superfamily hydrolase (TIGR01509 family)
LDFLLPFLDEWEAMTDPDRRISGAGDHVPELVIFDCDGVVVDSEVLSCQCLADTLVDHGIDVSLDDVLDRFLGRGFGAVEDHYRQVRRRPMPEAFRRELGMRRRAAYVASLKPISGVREALAAVPARYCLASSSDPERIGLSLRLTGLEPDFDGRIFHGAMVSRGKPAPDLFLHAAAAMGARPEKTVVIEDSAVGIAAGKSAGMTAWGFTGGSHCVGRNVDALLAAAGADRVFGSMSAIGAELRES